MFKKLALRQWLAVLLAFVIAFAAAAPASAADTLPDEMRGGTVAGGEITEYIPTPVGDPASGGYIDYIYVDKNGSVDLREQPEYANEAASANLPASYDSRSFGYLAPVEEQGDSASCWAFGALCAMETSARKEGLITAATDFSEGHLSWFTGKPRTDVVGSTTVDDGIDSPSPFLEGGSWLYAVMTVARGSGPELEECAPVDWEGSFFTTTFNQRHRYVSTLRLEDASLIDKNDRARIKREIIEHGALMCSYYDKKSSYKFGSTTAYNNNGEFTTTNHAVAVIGWDDNYSKDNFAIKPASNGAWLIRNSWGDDWGDDGYFWLSYEDTSVGRFVAMDMAPVSAYDNNYQYDGAPDGTYISINGTGKGAIANVFMAEGREQLTSFSFLNENINVNCTAKVYLDPKNGNPESGKLAATKDFRMDTRGYHTIKLDAPVALRAGQRFSIVLEMTASDGTARLSVEGSDDSKASSRPGQSYYRFGTRSWKDSFNDYNNVCLKAQTVNSTVPDKSDLNSLLAILSTLSYPTAEKSITEAKAISKDPNASQGAIDGAYNRLRAVTGIGINTHRLSFRDSEIKLAVGDTMRLSWDIEPDRTTDDLSFTTSNPNVAWITQSGIVTALAEGTARISAYSGDHSARCTVTVTKSDSQLPDHSSVTRLAGSDRISTASAISAAGWQKADTVVIANAYSFPDALAGVPLAAACDAPILLTDGKTLTKPVLDEMKRLGTLKAYLLGGEAAVASAVENALHSSGITTQRLAGSDRYATATAIAAELLSVTGKTPTQLFFASGESFPDALSVSTPAALMGSPIFYLPRQGAVRTETAAGAQAVSCTDAVILGGTAAVSDEGAKSLEALGYTVRRISGIDRFATALAVCREYDSLFTGDSVALATGLSFPDALAGGAFAAKQGIPLLLTGNTLPDGIDLYARGRNAKRTYVFGGKNAVPARVSNLLLGD
ncbi:MAG: hypothetical protein E7559_08365 [Ruminococcaceae bacterium]|nr:hypothetical protein [Oscillospiraceae bacterium]